MFKYLKMPKDITLGYMPPTAAYVYTVMLDLAGLKDRCCYISQVNLAKKCLITDRTIRKILKTLEYLKVIKYIGYHKNGTVKYQMADLTPDFILTFQWQFSGRTWETISDVADKEITGHRKILPM